MRIQADYALEKSEVAAVLASGIFARAPNLLQILTYISSKYFEGLQEEIKEYNIAVEALGRSPDFDQKRDSIVRVEAHRLRKRLREFYENDGADHVCQIAIPPGQYAPIFVIKGEAHLEPPAKHSLIEPPASQVQIIDPRETPGETGVLAPAIGVSVSKNGMWWQLMTVLVVGAIVVTVLLAWLHAKPVPAPTSQELSAQTPSDEIRLLAGVDAGDGNSKYVDAVSHTWSGDRFFSGGSVFQATAAHAISGTRDPQLYQSRREGAFSYDIPLGPGVYELRLYFGETLYGDNNIAGGGETSRIFRVSANGRPLLSEFDVIADVGASAADVKVFKDISPASDGKLHLKFEPGTNPAFVNGIEIVSGISGKLRPIRMVSRDRGLRDRSGRTWESDRYIRGGQLVLRNESLVGSADPELYRGERYGNLTYTIPVAQPGRYTLKLYFVESWFGPGRPGGGGEGSRIFDIHCNGVALRRNFDIFKEAGGPNRTLILSFEDVEPDPQGKVVVSLIPRRNYACINALELLDQAK